MCSLSSLLLHVSQKGIIVGHSKERIEMWDLGEQTDVPVMTLDMQFPLPVPQFMLL